MQELFFLLEWNREFRRWADMLGVYIVLLSQIGPGEFRAQITGHGRENDFVATGRTPGLALNAAWKSFLAWRRVNRKQFARYRKTYIERT